MDERLAHIAERLDDQDRQIAKLTHFITGNGDGDGLLPRAMKRDIEIAALQERCRDFQARFEKLEDRLNEQGKSLQVIVDNPPLLWYARFRTRQTVAVIVLIFILLSILIVSEWRNFIFGALGLPGFGG